MNPQLERHLSNFSTNPYLFIGSGLSRRYISLPTWEDLLRLFLDKSNIPGNFGYFRSKNNSDLTKVASNLADIFNDIWWSSNDFTESREKFGEIASSKKEDAFKIEVSEIVRKMTNINPIYEDEVNLLKTSTIDGVITTNWDLFIQEIFPDFNAYIGQKELLFSEGISIGEIYKIHGCVTRPTSLIVTHEDYNGFNKKNAYLAAKLLTIFLEHPIIFLGYSLSDNHIREILKSIVECLDIEDLEKLRNRLIFVEWEKGTTFQMTTGMIQITDDKPISIQIIKTDSFTQIFETLNLIKRKIPVKILKKIKNSVVDLVKSSSPTTKIYIQDIENIDSRTDVEFAVGVGIIDKLAFKGYESVTSIEIFEDIIFNNKSLDPSQLINKTFPNIYKGRAFIPVYKYLRSCSFLNEDGSLNEAGRKIIPDLFKLRSNPPECFIHSGSYAKKADDIRRNTPSVVDISDTYEIPHSLIYITLLETSQIDCQQLLDFLKKAYDFLNSNPDDSNLNTNFRRLVCLFDYLNYGLRNTSSI